MKLIKEELDKKWNLVNEYSLNKEMVKEVWMFYSLYDICLALCKKVDLDFKKKNSLINRLISNPSDSKIYSKIKSLMVVDVKVINDAMDIIEDLKEGGVLIGDYKKPTMFAININE